MLSSLTLKFLVYYVLYYFNLQSTNHLKKSKITKQNWTKPESLIPAFV